MAQRFLQNVKGSNLIGFIRQYSKRYSWDETAVKYDGFTYYKRSNDVTEEPIQPSKLFLVKRIKPFKGNPYWEKQIMTDLKIDKDEIAIVKNIPENNARLWRIKHLIEVKPINFVDGEPKASDVGYTWLRDNGDFFITKKLTSVGENVDVTQQLIDDDKRMDGNTLRRDSRKKWMDGW